MPMAALQPRRHHAAFLRAKPPPPANGKPAAASSKPKSPGSPSKAPPPSTLEERTVKQLRLAKALTLPEATAVSEACRRMAARRADAALLTDDKGVLSGIVTAEDISGRVIAEGLSPDETNVARVMTRNPVYVTSNSSATEALQKMVQGKFRHLPVVEHGEIIAMLDITKFLCGAISRIEKAAEQGNAIAAVMEGVEQQEGNEFADSFFQFLKTTRPHAFIENLRDQMFKPSLSTIITENSSVPAVSPSDLVTVAAKKMREHRVNSVVVMTGNILQGIITSNDLVLRVVAQTLSPEVTFIEKVMTASPGCATLYTSILEALQSMQDRKFRHIPVVDKRGHVIACLDALQLTHTAISMVEGASGPDGVANAMVQKFGDSALALHPAEEYDLHSEESRTAASDSAEGKHTPPPLHVGNAFSFKIEDRKGRMHRFSCVSESLDELLSAIAYRLGTENEKANVNLLYNDDEGDRVLLATDADLVAAIEHARSTGWKVLRLHIDDGCETGAEPTLTSPADTSMARRCVPSLRLGRVASAAAVAGVGVMVYLRCSRQ